LTLLIGQGGEGFGPECVTCGAWLSSRRPRRPL